VGALVEPPDGDAFEPSSVNVRCTFPSGVTEPTS
jgi:hypothetical protein